MKNTITWLQNKGKYIRLPCYPSTFCSGKKVCCVNGNETVLLRNSCCVICKNKTEINKTAEARLTGRLRRDLSERVDLLISFSSSSGQQNENNLNKIKSTI